jgi:hypothetical protein
LWLLLLLLLLLPFCFEGDEPLCFPLAVNEELPPPREPEECLDGDGGGGAGVAVTESRKSRSGEVPADAAADRFRLC